jgi:hypothetical protein
VPEDEREEVPDAPGDVSPDVEEDGTTDPVGDDGPEHAIWRPAPGTSWQWQLTGYPVDRSLDVDMYDIDLFDAPQATIDALHAEGRIVVCYLSAGSWEGWRDDADSFPATALGNELDGWPDERWLDVRDAAVRAIMLERLDLAAEKGCDGVEPDNVDGYANDPGFALTYDDQIAYNTFIAREARSRGLSVGLKNDLEQIGDLVDEFDWALDEECFAWDECPVLSPFVEAGKAVFQVEYGDASLADEICPRADALDLDTIIKRLDLDAWRVGCR